MADHRVDEGILDAVPGERGNIGIARGGSGDGTDAKLRANALHTLADLAVEVVCAALHVGLSGGIEENLREDALALLRLTSVLHQQLHQRLGDRDVDGDFHLVGNLATDVGQLLVVEVIIAPFKGGQVFQVAAVAEIEDEPPISGFSSRAFVVANLHDVGHGDEVLLAAGALLDGELGSFGDKLLLAEAVHNSTKGTEIDALGGIGKASLIHRGLPLADKGFIDKGRADLRFLALDDERLLLGVGRIGNALNGAVEEAIEVLHGGAVLQAGLLGVLALAELLPVFEECRDLLGLGFLRIGDGLFEAFEGEAFLLIESDDGIVDFVEGLGDLALGLVDGRRAVLAHEGFGIVVVCHADASGVEPLFALVGHADVDGESAVLFLTPDVKESADENLF